MKKILYLLLSLMVSLCCYDDYSMPCVLSSVPGSNEISIDPRAQVTVTFSKSMDRVKTANEFSLSSKSGEVSGSFSWSGNDSVMTFVPSEPLSRATKYTIRITEDAEDSKGNDLRDEFVSSFYTAGDDLKPRVESFSPSADSIGNTRETIVTLVFSEEMDPGTIYDGLSVSPAIEGLYEWNSNCTVATFRPLYGFSYGITYTVSVNTSIKDAAGNSLDEDHNFNFTVGDDFIPPELTVYQENSTRLYFDENFQTHGAEKNGGIVLEFSEEVAADKIVEAVSLSPAAVFYIRTDTIGQDGLRRTRANICFTENLESEQIYTLRVSSVITDLQMNNLERDYRYVFVTDGASSLSPYVIRMGQAHLIDTDPWRMNDIEILPLEVNEYGNAVKLYDDIVIDFSSAINPLSLEISVDLLTGDAGSPSVVNIEWPEVVQGERFTRLGFGLYGVSPGKTYAIRIRGGSSGLRDKSGNFMKDDFVQIIKFY